MKILQCKIKWWIKNGFPEKILRTASTVNKGVSNQSDLLVAKKNPTPLNCSGLKECVCGFDMLDDYTETILVY